MSPIFLAIVTIVAPIFMWIFLGWFYARMQRPDLTAMNQIAVDLLAPLFIFFALTSRPVSWQQEIPLLLSTLVMVLGSGALGWLLCRCLQLRPSIVVPPLMFNNGAYIGIPVATLALGQSVMPLAAAMFIVANTLQFSIGIKLIDKNASLSAILRSPTMLATYLAIAYHQQSLFIMPQPLVQFGQMVTTTTISYMLLSLGTRMAQIHWQELRYGLLIGLACPLVSLVPAFALLQTNWLNQTQQQLLWLYAFYPPAIINYLLAERLQMAPKQVASIVFAGNLWGLVFIPLSLYPVLQH